MTLIVHLDLWNVVSDPPSDVERMFYELFAPEVGTDEVALVARLTRMERLKSAAAADQARTTAALDEKRRARDAAAGLPKSEQCRGLSSEVAVEAGELSEWRATMIVRESACLTVEDRRTLDAELCADTRTVDGMGDARVTA